MMLTQLAAVARRTGYPVVEVSGWKTRTRPGGMAGVRTVICHHTANGGAKGNYPSLRVVRDGRAGLPGPLAHFGLGLDGTIYVIAAGKCNHAGVSRVTDYTNSYAIGIEAEAIGTPGAKGDWPAKQMDSYARLCAALVDEFDLAVTDVRGHKETCSPRGRKIDPSFSMPNFRRDTAAVNLKTPPQKEDDVPTVSEIVTGLRPTIRAEIRAQLIDVLKNEPLIANKATTKDLSDDPKATSPLAPIAWFLQNIEADQDNDRDADRQARARLEGKVDQLLQILAGAPATPQ